MTYRKDCRIRQGDEIAAVSVTTLMGDGELAQRAAKAIEDLDGVTIE